MMKSSELRTKFLEFFKKRGHTIVPSDSLVPANDRSLYFTGAGMNQFKDYFLGIRRDMKRAASCQKCFRTGDVEQVGQTPSHLTFFEMLGNFSFGDYFKAEAISFAFDFLTHELKISSERLWVSVYESDQEAYDLWVGSGRMPKDRVVRMGAKDNFWPSNAPTDGPNGPCGPCSEIYYDYQRSSPGKKCPDPKKCSPACSCGRFVEIWNLVFTSFNRQSDGSLKPLPQKNIDTGMGLERLTAVMQGKMAVFETDLFVPIEQAFLELIQKNTRIENPKKEKSLFYAIADHVRALTMLIGDGVVPSNDGRGYVLRMLLRKAERGGMALGFKKLFLSPLVPIVVKIMQEGYPELAVRREGIALVIRDEEDRFWKTLEEKIPLLVEEIQKVKSGGQKSFSAVSAARVYDTHGLSYDEIADLCRQEKMNPPSREDFEKALADLQAKSRSQSGFSGNIFNKDQLQELVVHISSSTNFVGYDALTAPAKVIGLIQENRSVKEVRAPAEIGVLLDRSPFYGESGGQVGDAGLLQGPQGKVNVADTQHVGNVLFHKAQLVEGTLQVGETVTASVDADRRRKVAQNHTGTHLLHSALRKILGEHVVQAGSLVAPDHLRFDFSHSRAVTGQQIKSVQSLVNEWIEMNLTVSVKEMPIQAARAQGAMALFGEKYDSEVRVVSIGEVSKELCGGTHLNTSGEIGLLTVIEEGSVAAGVRRIEALSGRKARMELEQKLDHLQEVAERLKAPVTEIPNAVDRLLKETKRLEEEVQRLKIQGTREQAGKMTAHPVGSFSVFFEQIPQELDPAALRSFADAIRNKEPEAIVFLTDRQGFCVAASGETAQKKGILASQLLKFSTEIAGGSGGGQPAWAQGRIKEPAKFSQVRERLIHYVKEKA